MKIDRALLLASWHSWIHYDAPPVRPAALRWLWTLAFAAALALAFTKLGLFAYAWDDGRWRDPSLWLHWFARNFVVCGTIAAIAHLAFDALAPWARPRLRHWAGWQRTLFFAGVPMASVLVGWPLGMALNGVNLFEWVVTPQGSRVVLGSIFLSLLVAFVLHQFFALKARQLMAEKRATEAQLQLLQAQMEPHFLFNTLANVQGLIEHEPARAHAMLAAFTEYLRASLGQLRTHDSTLGAELALAEAYLRLLKMRMQERLAVRIEVDEAALAAQVPPLLLQPLVENALQHGLEPKVEGGTVTLRARVEAGRLHLSVIDDGLGLDAPRRARRRPGAGVALDNLRERLRVRYGDAAALVLRDAGPGTRADIELPFATA